MAKEKPPRRRVGASSERKSETREQGQAGMRRDTPRDLPALREAEGEQDSPRSALARMSGLETLESAYEAWLALKQEHAAARLRFREEHERLDHQGSFLVGAVRASGAEAEGEPALVPTGAEGFLREAEERISRARQVLSRQEAHAEAGYQEALAEIRATLTERVRRYLQASRPRVQLLLRKVGASRSILHVARVGADEAVLLCFLFTGRIPSRYGFLFDDSTEDVALPPAPLYPDEEVTPEAVRPEPSALEARVRAPGEVLPLKGFLPVFVPRPSGGEDFFRLLQRGAVMEVELADGSSFRNLLSREEAERFAGHLLRLKLAGKVELEIEAG